MIGRLVVVAAVCGALAAVAKSATIRFGSGENVFEMEFVTIGNPGNPADEPDHTGLAMGAVDYVYRIAKFEAPCDSVAKASQAGADLVSFCPRRDEENWPFETGNWTRSAQFVNWLNTSRGHSPAYKLDELGRFQFWEPGDPGYDAANPIRNSMARFVFPTFDEWHKAAYYDPTTGLYFDYANGSDTLPMAVLTGTTNQNEAVYANSPLRIAVDVTQAGGLSPYGTMGQTGNANEWEEGFFVPGSGPEAARVHRSGRQSGTLHQAAGNSRIPARLTGGVRVVDVSPEPSSRASCWIAALLLMGRRNACRSSALKTLPRPG